MLYDTLRKLHARYTNSNAFVTEVNFTEKYITDNKNRKFMFKEHKRRGLMLVLIEGMQPYGKDREVYELTR